jgi:CPA2 family monovalent cation:H+ antiporter-2
MSASGNAASLALTAVVFAVAMFSIVSRLSRAVEGYLLSHGYGHEATSLYALGIGLLVSALAAVLGISATIGAYFTGFAMAETQAGNRIKRDLLFLRDFFLLFFFVSFGTTLFVEPVYGPQGEVLFSVPALPQLSSLALLLGIALSLAVVIIMGNFLVFGFFGKRIGLSNDEASMAATLLTPLGEFLVIIATTVAQARVISAREMSVLSPLVFVLILVTIFIFKPFYDNRRHHLRAMEMFPESPVVRKPSAKEKIHKHSDFTLSALYRLANNSLTLLCILGLGFFLYDSKLSLSLPSGPSRELVLGLALTLAAAYPLYRVFRELSMVYRHLKRLGARGQLSFSRLGLK